MTYLKEKLSYLKRLLTNLIRQCLDILILWVRLLSALFRQILFLIIKSPRCPYSLTSVPSGSFSFSFGYVCDSNKLSRNRVYISGHCLNECLETIAERLKSKNSCSSLKTT